MVFSPSLTQTLGSKYFWRCAWNQHQRVRAKRRAYFIWLVLTIRVSNLLHDVVFLVENIIPDTGQVRVLEIGIKVDFHNTMPNSICVLLLAGTRSTVEDKKNGLVLFLARLLLDICLMLAKQFGMQLDIPRLVHAMNVAKTCGNGKIWTNIGQGIINIPYVFWLSVKRVVVDVFVVYTVFLSTSDANFL